MLFLRFHSEIAILLVLLLWLSLGIVLTVKKAICIKSVSYFWIFAALLFIPMVFNTIGNAIEDFLMGGFFFSIPTLLIPLLAFILIYSLNKHMLKYKTHGDLMIFNVGKEELYKSVSSALNGSGINFKENDKGFDLPDSESSLKIEYSGTSRYAKITLLNSRGPRDFEVIEKNIRSSLKDVGKFGFYPLGLLVIAIFVAGFAMFFTNSDFIYRIKCLFN